MNDVPEFEPYPNETKTEQTTGLIEAVCPICGKLFYPKSDWGWTIRFYKTRNRSWIKKVCSYGCKRHYEKLYAPKELL